MHFSRSKRGKWPAWISHPIHASTACEVWQSCRAFHSIRPTWSGARVACWSYRFSIIANIQLRIDARGYSKIAATKSIDLEKSGFLSQGKYQQTVPTSLDCLLVPFCHIEPHNYHCSRAPFPWLFSVAFEHTAHRLWEPNLDLPNAPLYAFDQTPRQICVKDH